MVDRGVLQKSLKRINMFYFVCPPPTMKSGSDVVGLRTAEEFRSIGMPCKCLYLWPEFLARHLFWGKPRIFRKIYTSIISPFSLICLLFRFKKGDYVWINSVSLIYDETKIWFEALMVRRGVHYIYHLQDYWFDTARHSAASSKRIELADMTVVVSHELRRQVLSRFPDAKVVFLEEPIDTDRVRPVKTLQKNNLPVLVWTGNPMNLMRHFPDLVEVLDSVSQKIPFKLRIISGSRRPKLDLPVEWEWFPYSLDKEAEFLAGALVGLAPLIDTVYSRCKDVYKVKTYMAAGVVPMTTGIGHCLEVVKHGETGFMFNSKEEWEAGLIKLLEDHELARSSGQAARNYAVEHLSHKELVPVWYKTLQKCIAVAV